MTNKQHISDEIAELRRSVESGERSPVTEEEWSTLRMNTWEREHLYPVLSKEALISVAEKHIEELGGELPTLQVGLTYNEALCRSLAPELIRRLRGDAQFA